MDQFCVESIRNDFTNVELLGTCSLCMPAPEKSLLRWPSLCAYYLTFQLGSNAFSSPICDQMALLFLPNRTFGSASKQLSLWQRINEENLSHQPRLTVAISLARYSSRAAQTQKRKENVFTQHWRADMEPSRESKWMNLGAGGGGLSQLLGKLVKPDSWASWLFVISIFSQVLSGNVSNPNQMRISVIHPILPHFLKKAR